MVKLSVEMKKRDFIWVGLLIVLVGAGFVMGLEKWQIMGHSADEINAVLLFDQDCHEVVGVKDDGTPTLGSTDNQWHNLRCPDGEYMKEYSIHAGTYIDGPEKGICCRIVIGQA